MGPTLMKFELIISFLGNFRLESLWGWLSPPGPTQTLLMYLCSTFLYFSPPRCSFGHFSLPDLSVQKVTPSKPRNFKLTRKSSKFDLKVTMMPTKGDRMMVDTGYSSDNNGVDPVFTNYTHSHIASVTVTMTRMLLMISFVTIYNVHIH